MISIVKWLLIILASGMIIYYVLKIISDGIHDIKKECQKNGYKGSEKFLFIISRVLFGKDEEREKIIEETQEDVKDGYKLYIDGQEVDIDTINLDNYEITIKDDEKIVILDRK